MRYIVAYDIGSDNRRARVAAILSAWGDRVQKSIFECEFNDADRTETMGRIEAIIDPSTDIVQAFRQCRPAANTAPTSDKQSSSPPTPSGSYEQTSPRRTHFGVARKPAQHRPTVQRKIGKPTKNMPNNTTAQVEPDAYAPPPNAELAKTRHPR